MGFFRVIYFLISCIPVLGYSQVADYHCGARSLGIGHADQTVADAWSVFNNIGGISGVEQTTAFFSYVNRYGLESINSMAAGVVASAGGAGNFTLNVFRFGDRAYNEQKLALGYGNKIGFVRLGFQVNYIQLNVEGLGRSDALALEFGGIIELVKKLVFAAHIFNLNIAKLEADMFVPVIMQAGLSYRPVKQLMINVAIIYDSERYTNWTGGLEYGIFEKLYLRVGFRAAPSTSYFGLGFYPGRFKIDYAFSRYYDFGFMHEASVSVSFGKIK